MTCFAKKFTSGDMTKTGDLCLLGTVGKPSRASQSLFESLQEYFGWVDGMNVSDRHLYDLICHQILMKKRAYVLPNQVGDKIFPI